MGKMKALYTEIQEQNRGKIPAHPYSLKAQIVKCSQGIKPRHYQSQPKPKAYSKPYQIFFDHAVPSQMQEAFAKSVS